jgi:predicted transcriptional regulator
MRKPGHEVWTVQVPPDLDARLKEQAEREGESLSTIVRAAVRRYLNDEARP